MNAAPPENPSIEIYTSKLSPTIGDSLTVICTVTVPEGFNTGEPYILDKSPFLDIERVWKKKETPDSGILREYYGFLTYVLSPDTLSVGPLNVDYTSPDGDTGTASSNKITLIVKGVIKNPEAHPPPPPKPNRGPVGIASRGIPLWLTVLIILLAVTAAACVVYFFRKRRVSEVFQPPPKPVDEIGEFERIRALRLHEKEQIKELYILVSDAMRGFIHRNMKLDALYETSEEIMIYLSRDSIDASILDKIGEVFHESDMVKFAKYTPPADISLTIIDRALLPVKTVLKNIEREKEKAEGTEAECRRKKKEKTVVSSQNL